jgi:serine O-acetyltransferase
LRQARDDWRARHRRHSEHGEAGFPSRKRLEKIVAALCGARFPLRLGPSFVRAHNEAAFVAETWRPRSAGFTGKSVDRRRK